MRGIDGQLSHAAEMSPLGDAGLLVRFGSQLNDEANRAALSFAARLNDDPVPGVLEVVPSLVSVLVRYDPEQVSFQRLAGELALRMQPGETPRQPRTHIIEIRFEGEDLAEVTAALEMSTEAFVAAHNAAPLRVLTTGFAPGFVYCGLHPEKLALPRRTAIRQKVSAGSVLFAAGQTAIAATDIPTGWHVIGHTDFRNFHPASDPPTMLRAGDLVQFRVAT